MIPRAALATLLMVCALGCGVTPDDLADVDATRADGADESDDGADGDAVIDASDDRPDAARDGTAEGPDAGRIDASAARADAARADAARDASMDAPHDRPADADAVADRLDASDRPAPGDGGCPPEMALVQGRICVDRWEAHLEAREMDGGVSAWSPYLNPGTRWVRAVSTEGEVPQGYITGAQSRDACRNAGKHLCALNDWLAACRGPAGQVYPYGNTYVHRRCNEGRTPHPVIQFYGTSVGVFTFERMNNPGINQQPDSLAPTGAFVGCLSPDGLADMVGNLHEWIDDPNGTFKGGFYADAETNGRGCLYTTTAHNLDYRDYSTGFRCCADPR
jgi:sulfatase modifying factor 1